MAVGKSAVGRTLARRLGRAFVDLDKVIEKSEGMKSKRFSAGKASPIFDKRRNARWRRLYSARTSNCDGRGCGDGRRKCPCSGLRVFWFALPQFPRSCYVERETVADARSSRAVTGLCGFANFWHSVKKAMPAGSFLLDTSDLTVDQVVETSLRLLH